jgi:hypothetical protein
MGRLSNSWALARSSWAVLRADKVLAVVPVISAVVSALVAVAFGGAAYLTTGTTDVAGESEVTVGPLTWVVGAVGYLAVVFTVTFFTAVLVAGAHDRLTGGDATLGRAFGVAGSRLGPIFAWSMLTGTVGLVLQAVRERLGVLGQLVMGAVGMAWEIVTWLAVPTVVVEGLGPFAALKRSAGLFRATWGENLVAQAGFGLLGFVLALPALLVFGGSIALAVADGAVGGIVTGVLWVLAGLWIVGVSVVLSAMSGIYRTALYLYATDRPVTAFPREELAAAFAPKRGRP